VGNNPETPDQRFLAVVKKSSAYRGIHRRLLSLCPQDAWTMDGFAFYVFELAPEESRACKPDNSSIAIFAVNEAQEMVITAKILTPDETLSTAWIQEWDKPEQVMVLPLPPSWLEV
jgi:Mg2+/Co2+ transporter CorB